MTDLKLAKSRRVRLVVTAVAVAVALVGCGIGYGIFSHRQAEQIATHVSTFQTLIEQRNYEEAQKHFDQLTTSAPSIASDPQIQKLSAELARRVREEQARRANFRGLIEATDQAGDEQPDRKLVEAARRLATSDSEKARVLKLENMIAEADRRQQADRDQDFLRQLKELNARIDVTDQVKPDEQALAEARHALATLITQNSGISACSAGSGQSDTGPNRHTLQDYRAPAWYGFGTSRDRP